jgi:DNA-binding NarL/FixJ family response regulator
MGNCGTILVVDHDDRARAAEGAVACRLGLPVLEAESAEAARAQLQGLQPTLAIVEVELPGPTNGLEFLRELHDTHGKHLPVILVSAERTAPIDHAAGLLLGADDYVAKPFDGGELLARVRRSLGRLEAPATNSGGETVRAGETPLSPREREILELLSEGLGQTEIAQKLVVSPKTVGTHIQHILSKLGVHSRAQAVAEAYRRGLVAPDFAAHELLVLPA